MKFRPFRFRLMLTIVAVAVVPLGIAFLLFLGVQLQSIYDENQQRQNLIGRYAAGEIRNYLGVVEKALRNLDRLTSFIDAPPVQKHELMSALLFGDSHFRAITFFDAQGVQRERVSRQTLLSQPYHQIFVDRLLGAPQQEKVIRYSDVHYDDISAEPLLSLIYPITNPQTGGVEGYFVADAPLYPVWDVVSRIDAGDHTSVFVVDEKGQVIAHPDPSVVLRKTRFSFDAGALVQNGLSFESALVTSTAVPLTNKVLTVFVERAHGAVLKPILAFLLYSAVALGLALPVVWFIVIKLSRYLVRPVEQVTQAARNMQEGDFSGRIRVEGDDEIGLMAHTFNDMSARLHDTIRSLKREQRLRDSLIDSMPDLIAIKDRDRQIVDCNQAFLSWLNRSKDEIVGRGLDGLLEQNVLETLSHYDEQVLSSGVSVRFDLTVQWSDRPEQTLDCVKVPLRSGAGETVGLISISRDMTTHKDLEDQLRHSQKLDAIGRLTGGIAHDFNNILGIVIGNLELAETFAMDDEARERLKVVRNGTLRAVDLTRKLLSFSRKTPLAVQETLVNDVVRNLDVLLRKSLTPKIDIVYDLDDDLWPTNIDPGDLQDALLNLALNASDAMSGGGTLTIETGNKVLDAGYLRRSEAALDEAQDDETDFVVVGVSDTGTGIPADELERVFEPFFSTKEDSKGSGLGLSMVYGFAQRSGGDVKIYSEPGVGTTLRVYLPRYRGAGEAVPKVRPPTAAVIGGKETILVVDDEDALLELAVGNLENLGYRVLSAGNGQDALAILDSAPSVDLLFTDVIMPGDMDGRALAERAVAQRPGLKVLMTSGFPVRQTGTITADDALTSEFGSNLLRKPYNREELAQAIRTVLDDGGVAEG